MCAQILRCLKSKYLLFFSARWVFRYVGMDVSPDDDDYDDDDINLRPGNLSSNLPKGIGTC
jgi:hypothetical protein